MCALPRDSPLLPFSGRTSCSHRFVRGECLCIYVIVINVLVSGSHLAGTGRSKATSAEMDMTGVGWMGTMSRIECTT